MSRGILPMLSILLSLSAAFAQVSGDVAHWAFEGNFEDSSGSGNHATGPDLKYVPGHTGRALNLAGQTLTVPSKPELRISPGIFIDVWVRFESEPKAYEQIVRKDGEYYLRVDASSEGGCYAFFVFMGGWEPRVRGPEPIVGKWQHIVARWTGNEIVLTVDGQDFTGIRQGVPVPTDKPIEIGSTSAQIDELRIGNPGLISRRRLADASAAATDKSTQAHFGGSDGWEGWQAGWGATTTSLAGTTRISCPEATSMFYNANLGLDITRRGYLCLDAASTTAKSVHVHFLTDVGEGSVTVPLHDLNRTTILDLGPSPMWTGTLKALGITFADGGGHQLTLEHLYVSEKPAGKPLVYLRSLAPGRAVMRAGRAEEILTTVRGLARDVGGVSATLEVPRGVEIIGDATKDLGLVPFGATRIVRWTVRADDPVSGRVKATVKAPDMAAFSQEIDVRFEPPANFPATDYVPEPVPATSKYTMLMHYCPLWKFGTHYGWNRIEDWPNRRPAIGWYDEGTPEVADWHIKYALEHGIQAFIYCWYRENWGPDVKHTLGHAIHDGLFKSRYIDRFKYCIMWENGCAKGVQSVEDMMDNLMPYWMENYFTHPSYLVIDNKPVLFVWRPERVAGEVGGSENVARMFELMRAECRKKGFDGLYIIGCVTGVETNLLRRMKEETWDYSSAYGLWGKPANPPVNDIEGIPYVDHTEWVTTQAQVLQGKKDAGGVPDIVDVMCGWDPRPWHRERTTSYVGNLSVDAFRQACINAREIVENTPGNGLDKRLVVFDNWNEFGEGHYIEPCAGEGFGFVDAIKDVFCDPGQPCNHVIPEDFGLEPPERVYKLYREIVGPEAVKKERVVVDNLVARWSFEEDDETLAHDSSACGFHAMKQGFESAPGVSGRGFLCKGGTLSHAPSPEFWPPSGLTVELWYKTDVPGQSDQWMVNTIGQSTTGYRLGMGGGHVVFQMPVTSWSHNLTSPDPAPLGKWTHVAATYDNRTMRLYIDGKLVGELARGGKITPSTANLNVGSYAPGHPRAFFEGILDEVTIWDRPLSAEEIAEHAKLPQG